SKGKANALWNASPPSTQALASTSNAPAPITTRPPTSRNLSRSTSRSSVTSTSTATPHKDQPRPPPAVLDDLVLRVNTNAASTMLAIDSRIIRHAQESGRPLTTMKARAIDIGFAVDKYGRPRGRGKGKAVEKVAQEDALMEVDLPPVPHPQTGRGNALARKDSRMGASSLPTPAPSRTNSLNKGVQGALPLPPSTATHKPPPPAVFQHPPHAAPQPPPFAAPNPQHAALSHSPPSPQKGAEPQAKRRRVEPDENIGYQPPPATLIQTPVFASQGPALPSQAPSQRKQLGMRPARRAQPDKPVLDKDRAHPRPFRPPLMASQTPNADANRVSQTTHPQGKPPSGASSARGGSVSSTTLATKAVAPAAKKNPSPTKVPAAKCRSGRPPLALEEVPDSEEEDDKPLVKKHAPKRDSSPPVEADTSFDWDGAAAEMDAKGML
ncbi:hypothetical protein EV122DRAFT_226871, partial [Schizophyllum commune]